MEKFYLAKDSSTYLDKHIAIIRDNGYTIDELWIKPCQYYNYTKYHFVKGSQLCEAIPNKALHEYFHNENNNKVMYSGNCKLISIDSQIGSYYPRIYRPLLKNDTPNSNVMYFPKITPAFFNHNPIFDYIPYDKNSLTSGVQQLKILVDRLETIFNNVHPGIGNWNTYSNEIRNLLLLACTEVEAQLKGVLRANGNSNEKLTTNDYVKLHIPLRLGGYCIKYAYFPEIGGMDPFNGWDINNPTKSLAWYSAYNEVKHDRERNFEKATLVNAINAISAVAILLVAQYGFNIPYWKDLIGNFFEIYHVPYWDFHESYLPPMEGREWVKKEIIL